MLQLVMYPAKEGELGAFVQEWKAGVLPLQYRFEFRVEGAWSIRETGEFIWIISYDGPEGFETCDAACCASPERNALSPDPAQHLGHTDTRLITSVLP